MARIAIVCRYQKRNPALWQALQDADHETLVFPEHPEVHRDIVLSEPDIILFDWDSDDVFAESTFLRIRAAVQVPIAAILDDECDEEVRIRALRLGVDGYVCEPYSTRELLARIDAHLRRYNELGTNGHSAPSPDIQPGMTAFNGREVRLSPEEHRLLRYLEKQGDRVATREELCEHIWRTSDEDTFSKLRICVYRLRRKIEENPRYPKHILTKWGVGYYLAKES